MKENWTQGQLAAILLVMPNAHGDINFTILHQDQFLKREMRDFLRMLSLEGKETLGMLSLMRNLLLIMMRFSYPLLFQT